MKNEYTSEFDALWLQVISSGYALSQVDVVNEFCARFQAKQANKEVEFRGQMLVSFIYKRNGLLEDSWTIDLSLLQNFPIDYLDYHNLIRGVMDTAISLGRLNEIRNYAFKFLTQSKATWGVKIGILGLYTEFYLNDYPHQIADLEPVLLKIADDMGATTNATQSFTEKVNYLVGEWHRADDQLHELLLQYKEAPEQEKPIIVEKYLKKEHLQFYINYIDTYVRKIQ